jgi:alkaline phosphatase D
MDSVSRRALLAAGLGAGVLVTLPGATVTGISTAEDGALRGDPFMLGIASGEPWPDGFVLWTRLALEPLAEDGLGGMPSRSIPVAWEVAEDAAMGNVVARGLEYAHVESAHSMHVELRGLQPGREYFYRFRSGRHVSPIGRTLTSPARHETPEALSMAFASCAKYEQGFFTAYSSLAQDHPDLVLHLGDYIYERRSGTDVRVKARTHDVLETVTLEGYRQRHAQYKSDADLQAAHAIAPWLVVWDDHEVDNNYANDVPEDRSPAELNDTAAHFRMRRAAAFKAYYENMPLRASSVPAGADMKIYRTIQWGQLANFHMMDTRQYRDDQLSGDGWRKNLAGRLNQNRTITGVQQEKWLLDAFKSSTQCWDILGQQVFFAERDRNEAANIDDVSMDGWDGYVASRRRITQGWVDAKVRNAVVLTGDVHRHWANELKIDFKDPASPVVGSELVSTSITSGGNGSGATFDPVMAWNPHLKFYNDQRGYVTTRITKDSLRADFRVLDFVSRPGSPVSTKASFQINDAVPGLERYSPE